MANEAVVQTPSGLGDLPLAWLSLLITEHLDAEGRLKLFQAGKAMSRAVLQHEGTHLTLSTASKQTAAQQAAAQAVAAEANILAVKLQGKGQAVQLQPFLWPCVTSLELRKVTLPEDWAQGLYDLPNLAVLSFKSCLGPTVPPWLMDIFGIRNHTLPAVRKCTITQCRPSLHAHMVALLPGSKTLTHLVVDDRALLPLVHDWPCLTALQCVQSNQIDPIPDFEFQLLVTHPQLEHMVLGELGITEDYSKRPCKWKTLQLLGGVQDVMIAQLPLAGLECFTVGKDLMVLPDDLLAQFVPGCGLELLRQDPGAITANLRSCGRVVFKPTKPHDSGGHTPCFTPMEPCFRINGSCTRQWPGLTEPRLLAMMCQAAESAQGVLVLAMCMLSPEVLGVTRALNPAIHTLCLWNGIDVALEFTAGLLSSLPSTVRHLVIGGVLDASVIIAVLYGSQAPATLKLITLTELVMSQQSSSPLDGAPRQRVDAVAAKHQPHVRLQWQTVPCPWD